MVVSGAVAGNAGLFAKIEATGVVRNAKIYSANITGSAQNMGALAGQNLGTIENGFVDGVRITNTVAEANVGSLVGLNNGMISKVQAFNSNVNATGSESVAGGLVGSSVLTSLETSASISRSSAECNVQAVKAVGGLVGYIKGSIVENCYAGCLDKACVITSGTGSYAGGIVGISEFAE